MPVARKRQAKGQAPKELSAAVGLQRNTVASSGRLEGWNERNNRRLRETTDAPRECWLEGCSKELTPAQQFYCGELHAANARQQRRRAGASDAERLSVHFASIRYDAPERNRRPIPRVSDRDLIYDRVKPSEGRLPHEERHGRDLAPQWSGVALSDADREALDGVVCRICARWGVDCGVLTQHQRRAIEIRVVRADRQELTDTLEQVA